MTGTAEQHAGDHHAAQQQRHDLFGEVPTLPDPLPSGSVLTTGLQHQPADTDDHRQFRPLGPEQGACSDQPGDDQQRL